MNVFKFILKSIYPFRYYLLGITFITILHGAYASLMPYLIKLLINEVASTSPNSNKVWEVFYYLAGIQFIVFFNWRFYEWCLLRYEPLLKNDSARALFEYVIDHSYRFFQNNLVGSIAAKISDVASLVPTMIMTIINSFLYNFVSISIAVISLALVNKIFAIAILIWALAVFTISFWGVKKFNYLARNTAEAAAKIMGNVADIIGNALNVKLFAIKTIELKRVKLLQDDYTKASRKRRWFQMGLAGFQGASFGIYQTFCLAFLIKLYFAGKVTPGDFAFVVFINNRIMENLWTLSEQMRSFSENYGIVDQALKTIYVKYEIEDKINAKELVVSKGEIIFEEVNFHHDKNQILFENQNIKIKGKEKVGLVGYSGGGKTSFANLILRLFDLNRGRILIDNQDISLVTQDSLRQNIAMIPQDPSLFHRSILDNIKYAKMNASTEEIIKAAKKAHIHDFVTSLEDGYNSLVGERGIKLSGGQRQRISIARGFLKNAPILILDEATSQLDSMTESYIQSSLHELMQDKTVIVIAHRLSTLLYMDRILVFNEGEIIEDGTHEELLSKNGFYKSLWNSQVGGFLPENK